jgi:hypothetical protein
VPADNKHYLRVQVAKIVNEALESLGLDFPRADATAKAGLAAAKGRLLAERD